MLKGQAGGLCCMTSWTRNLGKTSAMRRRATEEQWLNLSCNETQEEMLF